MVGLDSSNTHIDEGIYCSKSFTENYHTIKWHKGDMMDSSKSLTKSCMSGLSGFTPVVDMDFGF